MYICEIYTIYVIIKTLYDIFLMYIYIYPISIPARIVTKMVLYIA